MNERLLCRMRITFRRGEEIKYISHLDLLRTWERALRRAGLPLAYSQGFNPHPRIVIAMPLPVGCTGGRELVDLWLEPLSPEVVVEALEPTLPAGLSVVGARVVPLKGPALPTLISCAVYEITLGEVGADEVREAVDLLLATESLQVHFRRKTFDLRPLVDRLAVRETDRGPAIEAVLLRDKGGRIGRPDVLLEALGLSDKVHWVHRLCIIFEEPEGEVKADG